jgi:hypothetical protein
VKPTPAPDADEVLGNVRAVVRALPREKVGSFLGELERVRVEFLLEVQDAAKPEEKADRADRALTPKQAAVLIGRSRCWISRHRHELPTTRLSSGRWVISESKLRRWLEARSK